MNYSLPWLSASSEQPAGDDVSSAQPLSLLNTVLVSIVAGALALTTSLGNLMVIVSFKMDRQLQTVSNYFLLSLSIADLSIGVFSMPLYTTYLIMQRWPLGPIMCDVWLSLDYTMSTASVANLLLICFDRYFSITRPLTYRAKRTKRRATIMITLAWLISALLWTPWIFAWQYIDGKRTVAPGECEIQFLTTNSYITIITAVLAFFLPAAIMCILYYRIFLETEKRQKELQNLQANRACKGPNDSTAEEAAGGSEELSAMLRGQYGTIEPEPRPTGCWSHFRTMCSVDRDSEGAGEDSSVSDPVMSQTTSSQQQVSIFKPIPKPPRNSQTSGKGKRSLFSRFKTRQNGDSSRAANVPAIKVQMANSKGHSNSHLRRAIGAPLRPNQDLARFALKSPPSELVSISEEGHSPADAKSPGSSQLYTIAFHSRTSSNNDVSNAPEESDLTENAHRTAAVRHNRPQQAQCSIESETIDLKEFSRQETTDTVLYDDSDATATNERCDITKPADDAESSDSEDDAPAAQQRETRVYPSTPSIGRRLTQTSDALRQAMEARAAAQDSNKARLRELRAKKKRAEKKQERKAVKTLSAILLAFVLTWTPYNIFTVVQSLCQCEINSSLYAIGESILQATLSFPNPSNYT